MIPERPGSGSNLTADAASVNAASYPEGTPVRFESILFKEPGAGSGGLEGPDFFADLTLDQVLGSMAAGREQYDLEPLFCTPLHEVDAVSYRPESQLRDLDPQVLTIGDGVRVGRRRGW